MRLSYIAAWLVVPVALIAADSKSAQKPVALTGYILDSACAYTKNLDKPISADCAKKCAANGSPLVLLTADGAVYLPIDSATPSKGQNEKLLPFAGQRVTVLGKVFDRGGSKAIVIEKIAAAAAEPKK